MATAIQKMNFCQVMTAVVLCYRSLKIPIGKGMGLPIVGLAAGIIVLGGQTVSHVAWGQPLQGTDARVGSRNGFADPEEVAIELGIGLGEVAELVRRHQGYFATRSASRTTTPSGESGRRTHPLAIPDAARPLSSIRLDYRQLARRTRILGACTPAA
jgi:hypothetical protein